MTMNILLFFLTYASPFNEANLTAMPCRSISIFSNPAGLGLQSGAEIFFTYHPKKLTSGLLLSTLGFGMSKMDTFVNYETGIGLKLPGAFSLGYAYDFGGTSSHIFGLICRLNEYFTLGYKTTIGDVNHMFGGISLLPFGYYLTIGGDIEYEGNEDILNYYFGAIIQPVFGVKLNFFSDKDLNWHAGIELGMPKFKLAGLYSRADKKISGGIVLSAQDNFAY